MAKKKKKKVVKKKAVTPLKKVTAILKHYPQYKDLSYVQACFLLLVDPEFGLGHRVQKLVAEVNGLVHQVGDAHKLHEEGHERLTRVSLMQSSELVKLQKQVAKLEKVILGLTKHKR